MFAIINYNIKKCWKPFLLCLAILAIVSLASKMEDIKTVEVRLSVFIYLGYTLAALVPAYCLYLDCFRHKTIYTIRASDLSPASIFLGYQLTGFIAAFIVFVVNLLVASSVKIFYLDRLLFDSSIGLLLAPLNAGGILSVLLLGVVLNILTFASVILFTKSKIAGILIFLAHYIAVIVCVNQISVSYLIFLSQVQMDSYYKIILIMSLVFGAYTLCAAVASALLIKKVGIEK